MKNIVTLIVIILILVTFFTCEAKNDSAFYENNISKNVIYLEALGNGFYYEGPIWGTLNYERTVIYSPKINCAIRIGLGYIGSSSHNKYHNGFSLPLLFNIISNPYGNHHIEGGIGVVLISDGLVQNSILGCTGSIKYRYQKKTKGIYFCSGWTPSFYFDPYFKGSPLDIGAIYERILHLANIGIGVGCHF